MAIALLLTGAPAAAQTYTVIDLGRLAAVGAGSDEVNSNLQVIGTSGGRVWIWDANGGMRYVADERVGPGFRKLNASGAIAGAVRVNGVSRPFFWRDNAAAQVPAPAGDVTVQDFTDEGRMLLRASGASYLVSDGVLHDLNRYFGVSDTFTAFAFSDDGSIGGSHGSLSWLRRPNGHVSFPLPTAPESGATRTTGVIERLGKGGHFLGKVTHFNGSQRRGVFGYVGRPDGTVTQLPVSRSLWSLTLDGINRHGTVVLTTQFSNDGVDARAYVYQDGTLIDLTSVSSPGWQIVRAHGLNDDGYIAAWGRNEGAIKAVLLVPAGKPIPVGTSNIAPAGAGELRARVTGRTLRLHWEAAARATGYVIEAGSVSGGTNLLHREVGPVTNIEANVEPGIYFVRVRARNAAGVSDASNEVQVVVP